MKNNELLSTAQVAEKLAVSRVTVFNKIKKGEIKAQKAGRSFVIRRGDLPLSSDRPLTAKQEKEIDKAVKMVITDFGTTLKLLSDA